MRVRELSVAVLKGTRLAHPEAVDLDETGLRDDRLFHVVRADGAQQLNALRQGLAPLSATWDREARRLGVRFPDGREVEAVVALAEPLMARVAWDAGRTLEGRVVDGPWSAALSEHLGEPVLLAMATAPARAVDVEPITLVSEASVARLEREVGVRALGARRFRMNIVVTGAGEHEEDEWYGRRLAAGDVVLRVMGPVPRCAVVMRDPATGDRDHDALRAIVRYRPPIPHPRTGEPVKAPFGVYARVERPGRLGAGDALTLLD
jgi:uncharacterized protein YcbX